MIENENFPLKMIKKDQWTPLNIFKPYIFKPLSHLIFASPRFMKNGQIDWQKLETQVSDLVNTAVETVAGAVKQRYVNDDGTWDSSIHG